MKTMLQKVGRVILNVPLKSFTTARHGGLRISRPTSLLLTFLFTLTFTLSFTPRAHAQWQSTTYTLHGGWNTIYLHGDATHASIETLLPPETNIISIWRWNPNPTQTQFSTSTLVPTNGTPEWSTWTRGGTANTLTTLTGQAAYLVECSGTLGNTYSVPIVHKVQPPRSTWVRNGANLLGFPTRNASGYPNMSAYFATFPVAISTNTKIYRYDGGPLSASNPIQVFNTATEPVDRTKAYWFEAAVTANFYAPLEVSPSNLDGLIYGRNGSLVSVRVRNRTAAAVNLTVAPVDSAPAPGGQTQITAAVPLTYRTFNTSSGQYEFTPVTTGLGVVVGPQSSVELTFGVDRSQITGTPGDLYASLLRFTDGGNLMDVYLPVSAQVTSLAGLWIGEATVTNVQSKVPGVTGTTTGRSFPLRVLLHVDNSGNARLLSQVFLGKLAVGPNDVGLSTLESGLKPSELATARRFTAVHLPPETVLANVNGSGSVAIGQTLVRTVTLTHKAPTNPYVHTYHPDHDNRNARFDADLPAGVESPTVTRECSFTFTAAPPGGGTIPGWGSSVIGGTYAETITGIHKSSTTVTGTFEVRRVSEIGSITTN
jgi:hypothetical protein